MVKVKTGRLSLVGKKKLKQFENGYIIRYDRKDSVPVYMTISNCDCGCFQGAFFYLDDKVICVLLGNISMFVLRCKIPLYVISSKILNSCWRV